MTEKPKRIQRRRVKGWKAPLDANGLPPVSVTRPGVFGNPFKAKDAEAAGYLDPQKAAVGAFEDWLNGYVFTENYQPERAELLRRLPELRGRNLMCFCKEGAPCHGDILLALANED